MEAYRDAFFSYIKPKKHAKENKDSTKVILPSPWLEETWNRAKHKEAIKMAGFDPSLFFSHVCNMPRNKNSSVSGAAIIMVNIAMASIKGDSNVAFKYFTAICS